MNLRIKRISILFAAFLLVFWLVDAWVDIKLNYTRSSYIEMLVTDIPVQELLERIFVILLTSTFYILYTANLSRLKRYADELEQSRQRYELLANNVTDVIWTMDLDGIFTYVSPSIERLRGFTADEVMKNKFADSLTPPSKKVMNDLMIRLQEYLRQNPGRIPSVLTDLEHTCKDGSSVWTEASISIIFNERNQPKFLVGVSRNISDRKAKEAEVVRSEQNYRLLADNSHDYIILHDMDGYINYLNPSALKASGYNPDEAVGMKILDFIPKEYYRMVSEIESKRESGDHSMFLYEMEIFTKDKKRIPVEITSSPVRLNGQIVSVLITARDITERIEARKLFLENEKRFRTYIENSPIPIVSVSASGSINYFNRSTNMFFEYGQDELENKNILDLVSPGFRDICRQKIEMADEKVFSVEISFRDKHGRELVSIVSGGRIDRNDLLLYIVDITSRKTAEERAHQSEYQLRELNAKLEDLVMKRTNELMVANKELESFSYTVSHDLRAPLRHIDMFSGLLSANIEKKEDEKAILNLRKIRESVAGMKTLIDHLLEFSRIGRSAIKKTSFHMDDLVNEVFEELRRGTNGNWKVDIQKLGRANADRQLLKMAWMNLASNAIKFSSRESEPRINIGVTMNRNARWYYIEDNGVGYNPDYSEKLFGVFKRLHSESEFEGTGIGLAFVKTIIEKHNGEIIGESTPGQGAKFSFTLSED